MLTVICEEVSRMEALDKAAMVLIFSSAVVHAISQEHR
jgi:hypothetical protein